MKWKNIFKRSVSTPYNNDRPVFGLRTGWGSFGSYNALKLSTVYACVDLISSSIAKLELQPYTVQGDFKKKDYSRLYYLLNVRPNDIQNAFDLKKWLIYCKLVKGNAYAYIERDSNNNILRLLPLHPSLMDVVINSDYTITYIYAGKKIDADNIIHLKMSSKDDYGIIGKSVLEQAAESLSLDFNAQGHSNSFFSGGASMRGILKPALEANIPPSKMEAVKEKLKNESDIDNGGESGGIIVLPAALEYQTISISPKDQMLIESRKFSVSDICRWFLVPEDLVNVESSKYNSNEASQLAFFSNCLQAHIEQFEIEVFAKIFLESEFHLFDLKFSTSNLYRLDAASQAEYYNKLVGIGAITPNEVRQELDRMPISGGNTAFVWQNLQNIENQTKINQ